MKQTFLRHEIEAAKLAGMFDGLYYALIDGMVDFEIKPSRYPAVVIRHIKKAYAMRFIFEHKQTDEYRSKL